MRKWNRTDFFDGLKIIGDKNHNSPNNPKIRVTTKKANKPKKILVKRKTRLKPLPTKDESWKSGVNNNL